MANGNNGGKGKKVVSRTTPSTGGRTGAMGAVRVAAARALKAKSMGGSKGSQKSKVARNLKSTTGFTGKYKVKLGSGAKGGKDNYTNKIYEMGGYDKIPFRNKDIDKMKKFQKTQDVYVRRRFRADLEETTRNYPSGAKPPTR